MKRALSVFLLATVTLAFLVICSRPGGNDDYYTIYDDLPAVKRSDSAYLLDTNFTVTAENFADCIDDYFSIPARLQFGILDTTMRRMTGPKKASAFADVFHDLPLTQIAAADYPWYAEQRTEVVYELDRTTGYYSFHNAIGHLRLYRLQNVTYLRFSRGNDVAHEETEVYFRTEEDPVSKLVLIGASLQNVSVEQLDNGIGNW
ncbi:MAG: hypothetical protein ACOX7K_08295 [Oscillospiraceae bacterium]